MTKERQNLGAIALRQNEGIPSHALADLMTQVVGMCGFIHAEGVAQTLVLEIFDNLLVNSRRALVEIMEEDEAK